MAPTGGPEEPEDGAGVGELSPELPPGVLFGAGDVEEPEDADELELDEEREVTPAAKAE